MCIVQLCLDRSFRKKTDRKKKSWSSLCRERRTDRSACYAKIHSIDVVQAHAMVHETLEFREQPQMIWISNLCPTVKGNIPLRNSMEQQT